MDCCIMTKGLTKAYHGTPVVDGIDLAVPQGSVYGFLGPNGAGKTTTMKMLLGLVHPSAGAATVLGTRVTAHNRVRVNARVGSLIESPSCCFWMSPPTGSTRQASRRYASSSERFPRRMAARCWCRATCSPR